jgi:hypothetical protein
VLIATISSVHNVGVVVTNTGAIYVQVRLAPTPGELVAVKLELGSVQTLAHQDVDGNWVLNEIPNYAEQLAICSQYDPTTGKYVGIKQGIEMVKLWENASPTSDFGAQTIALDLNEYDFIDVIFNSIITRVGVGRSATTFQMAGIDKDTTTMNTPSWRLRTISASETGAAFSAGFYKYLDGTKQASGTSDSICIPLAIYGVKGVTE